MVTAPMTSPIDSLLQKNASGSQASGEASRCSLGSTRMPFTRTKRFGDTQTTFLKPRNFEDERDTSIIENSIRFNGSISNDALMKRGDESRARKEKLLDRLRKLGLAPLKYVNKNTFSPVYSKKYQPPRRACTENNDDFLRPRVYECAYCPRLFFNKNLYRSHVIRHLKLRRCTKCDKPSKTIVALRRHQAQCQKKI